MKRLISAFLAVLMTLAVSATALAAQPDGNEAMTDTPGSVDFPVALDADPTPGYKGPVKDDRAVVTGPGFVAEDDDAPEGAVRLVVDPITEAEALEWFGDCAGWSWSSTGVFYAVFYEDGAGNRLKADGVKLTVRIPDGYQKLQVYSVDPDENGQFVKRFDTLTSSVLFTTNGRLYYGVVHGLGVVDVQISVGPGAPAITLPMTSEEMGDAVLSAEEKACLENGTDIHIRLTVEDITDTITLSDKQVVESAADGHTAGVHFDVQLLKQIGDRPWENVHETKKPIRITVDIPERLLGAAGREHAIVRVHNGVAELLRDLDDDPATIAFETSKFSTYAILYRDPKPSDTNPGASPHTGDDSYVLLWLSLMSVSTAGLFLVLFCGKKKKER